VPSSPSSEQMAEIKAAIVAHYNGVFDQSAGLWCMVGPWDRTHTFRRSAGSKTAVRRLRQAGTYRSCRGSH
jgi:hypothetical protein